MGDGLTAVTRKVTLLPAGKLVLMGERTMVTRSTTSTRAGVAVTTSKALLTTTE